MSFTQILAIGVVVLLCLYIAVEFGHGGGDRRNGGGPSDPTMRL